MNYYFMGAGGGRGSDKMEDPDTRITQDLAQTINGFTTCFCHGAAYSQRQTVSLSRQPQIVGCRQRIASSTVLLPPLRRFKLPFWWAACLRYSPRPTHG